MQRPTTVTAPAQPLWAGLTYLLDPVGIAAEQSGQREGHRDAGQFVRELRCRRPCAANKRVADRTSEVERRGQCAQRFALGPAALPAFERAHRMHGQTGDRRKLFLCVAGRFAERFELRSKRSRSARFHRSFILPPRVVS